MSREGPGQIADQFVKAIARMADGTGTAPREKAFTQIDAW
jgi:hypothetical protein